MERIDHILLIPSPTDGRLACFHLLKTVDDAAVDRSGQEPVHIPATPQHLPPGTGPRDPPRIHVPFSDVPDSGTCRPRVSGMAMLTSCPFTSPLHSAEQLTLPGKFPEQLSGKCHGALAAGEGISVPFLSACR